MASSGRRRALAAPLCPGCRPPRTRGPSGPLSRRAPARPARRRSPPDARTRPAASGAGSWPPRGPRGRGVAVYFPFGPLENKGRGFSWRAPGPGPLSEAGRRRVCFRGWGGVPRATALVPGMLARGQRGAGTSGGDLPPLVILWATPPPPGSLFSRVLELGTLHIQESTRFKNERGASFTMPSCRECWEGF